MSGVGLESCRKDNVKMHWVYSTAPRARTGHCAWINFKAFLLAAVTTSILFN